MHIHDGLKVPEIFYARKVSILSETDLLTGLFNRNSYEQKLKTYSSMCNQVLPCVYVDVNGLHELNNTRGHAAEDKMLPFADKTKGHLQILRRCPFSSGRIGYAPVFR